MYDNNYQSAQNIATVKSFFSRTSFLTLTISTAAFTLFLLLNTMVSSFGKQKNDVLASLYYFFGDNSVMPVNLITGIFLLVLFVLLSFGMLSAYLGATRNSHPKMLQGINIILGSLIYMVILASCLIIIALSSISVTYYQSVRFDTTNSYSQYSNYSNSSSLFFLYVAFGAGIITLIIALIRLILSIRRAANGQPLTTKGYVLGLISGIYCASITGISFIVSLCNLVMPYEYVSNNKMPDPATLLIMMITVLINAAMTLILIDTCILATVYSSAANAVNRNLTKDMYSKYATNLYDQTQNRKPYINPVQNADIPSPQAKPYTAQTHAQYMASVTVNPAPVQQQNPAQPTNSAVNGNPQQNTSSDDKINLDK